MYSHTLHLDEPVPVALSDEEETQQKARAARPFKWIRGELIGRGTYGRVYMAMELTAGAIMVVKQVEISTTRVSVVHALRLQSSTLCELDHPNIVDCLGLEETPSHLCLFFDYVPGGSIEDYVLKHGRFDEEVTKFFTGQILKGLEYLHSRGIIHRDLKADHVLIQTSGQCKITGFGIPEMTDEIQLSGGASTAIHSVFWMAPEVVHAQTPYDFKIDIWSLGCVVLEMWSGVRPWINEEAVAVLFKLYRTRQPPPVPNDVVLSVLANDFRLKCFTIDPEERPTTTQLRHHPYLVPQPGWEFGGFL